MLVPILGIVSSLIVCPGIVFSFVYFTKKQKTDLEKMKYQKEILELEIQKQNNSIRLLEEENRKLDKEIYEKN